MCIMSTGCGPGLCGRFARVRVLARSTLRSVRARVLRAVFLRNRMFCLRCGFSRSLKGWVRRVCLNLLSPGTSRIAGHAPCLQGCYRPARGGRPRSRRVPLDRGCDSRDAIVAPARTQAGPVTVYMPTPDEAGENDLSPASRASLRYRRRKEPEAIESRRAGMETRKARDIAPKTHMRRTHPRPLQEPGPQAHRRARRLKAHAIVPVARTGQRHPGNATHQGRCAKHLKQDQNDRAP